MEYYTHPEFGPIYPFNYFHGIFIEESTTPICTKKGKFESKLIHPEDILEFITNIKEKKNIKIGENTKSFLSFEYKIVTFEYSTAFKHAPKSIKKIVFHEFLGFCIIFTSESGEKFTILLSTLGLYACDRKEGNCEQILRKSRTPYTSKIAEVTFPDIFVYEKIFGAANSMKVLKLEKIKIKYGDLTIGKIFDLDEDKLINILNKINTNFKNHHFQNLNTGEQINLNIPYISLDVDEIRPFIFFYRPKPKDFLFHNYDFKKSIVSSSFTRITKLLSSSRAQTANCQSFAEALLNLIFNPGTGDHKKIEFMVKLGFGEIPKAKLPSTNMFTSLQSTLE